jgi:predicted protein tyrosine phosphatase
MILFICSQGRMRSRTGELLCLFGGLSARSAGTEHRCVAPVNDSLLREADFVFCMEAEHLAAIHDLPHFDGTRVATLGIPDRFDRLDPALVTLLTRSVHEHRPAVAAAMRQGALLLAAQPAYLTKLGTHTDTPADNPAYRAMPSV